LRSVIDVETLEFERFFDARGLFISRNTNPTIRPQAANSTRITAISSKLKETSPISPIAECNVVPLGKFSLADPQRKK
jgi:hypothetical protein